MAEGAGVRVEVADLGPGIPEEVRLRAFEPFFTVRPAGGPRGGTGLGLTVVRDLAAAHGGHARLRANAPRGTVAEVWFRAAS
jgi:signal transduction histidine kinase